MPRHSSSRRSGGRRRSSGITSMITTAVATYGAYRLANWAWKTYWQGEEEEEGEWWGISGGGEGRRPRSANNLAYQRQRQKQRKARIHRCRHETARSLADFLPTLQRLIEQHTCTTEETRQLKQLRAEKRRKIDTRSSSSSPDDNDALEQELWETIKVKSVTRMIAIAYAHSLLVLVLTVQVHLLGGKVFYEEDQEVPVQNGNFDAAAANPFLAFGQSSGGAGAGYATSLVQHYKNAHKQVLTQTYQFLFSQGIAHMMKSIHRAVALEMSDWDVTDTNTMNISFNEFQNVIEQVRVTVVEGRRRQRPRAGHQSQQLQNRHPRCRSLIRFLSTSGNDYNDNDIDGSDGDGGNINNHDDSAFASFIMDETWDILESPTFEEAEQECLDATFALIRQNHVRAIFGMPTEEDESVSTSEKNDNPFKPLAQVVTQLKHVSGSFYATGGALEIEGSGEDGSTSTTRTSPCYDAVSNLPMILELGDISFN